MIGQSQAIDEIRSRSDQTSGVVSSERAVDGERLVTADPRSQENGADPHLPIRDVHKLGIKSAVLLVERSTNDDAGRSKGVRIVKRSDIVARALQVFDRRRSSFRVAGLIHHQRAGVKE